MLELMELGNLRDYLRKVSSDWEGLQARLMMDAEPRTRQERAERVAGGPADVWIADRASHGVLGDEEGGARTSCSVRRRLCDVAGGLMWCRHNVLVGGRGSLCKITDVGHGDDVFMVDGEALCGGWCGV